MMINQFSGDLIYSDLLKIFHLLEKDMVLNKLDDKSLRKIIGRYPKPGGYLYRKSELLNAYNKLSGTNGLNPFSEKIAKLLQKKPTRTISGVAPITVLTKPFPCPGKCIFCPNDIRMPKSYLVDEPGAQRAERNWFDPYLQTYSRLQALTNLGHRVDKAELIVLGGTWSFYPITYQIWFIKECLRAMNEFGNCDNRPVIQQHYQELQQKYRSEGSLGLSNKPNENERLVKERVIVGEKLTKTYNQVISELYVAPERKAGIDKYQSSDWEILESEQQKNETARVRCVGLVLETRPDNISVKEVITMRRLGCTKAQIGVQSLQDLVLKLNNRGHNVAATRRAFQLLRQAGFKIHAHWMSNLYGSNPDLDKNDFLKLFEDDDFKPDELKIYPCSLIESAELMKYYRRGEWKPYSKSELLEVLVYCVSQTPAFCRLTRVIRDIPSTDIVDGNKITNFREVVDDEMKKRGLISRDIRAREIRFYQFDTRKVKFKQIMYQTSVSREFFLQYVVRLPNDQQEKLLGFLRLSLPFENSVIDELGSAAIIREVHVYGEAVKVGDRSTTEAQHLGLGKKLIAKAKSIAQSEGYTRIGVISAIGTREYYAKLGFVRDNLYQFASLI